MTNKKKKHEKTYPKPVSVWKCLECDNRDCLGYKEALRLRKDAELRADLLIEYYGWADWDVQ